MTSTPDRQTGGAPIEAAVEAGARRYAAPRRPACRARIPAPRVVRHDRAAAYPRASWKNDIFGLREAREAEIIEGAERFLHCRKSGKLARRRFAPQMSVGSMAL